MAGKKRQREGPSKKEEEQQKYYDRLLHMCRKDLNKQIKTTKNFECQKLIRKLKEQASANVNVTTEAATDTPATTTTTTTTNRNEVKLQELRDLSMEPVIRECLRRLGILTLNPKPTPAPQEDAKETTTTATHSRGAEVLVESDEAFAVDVAPHTDQVDESKNKNENKDKEGAEGAEYWIERILQHKRMRESLESWIEKVTEYRRWCVKQEESTMKKGKKNKKVHTEREEQPALQAAELSNSLFVRLGNQSDDEASDVEGEDDDAEGDDKKKKNRPGQRARKAKFEANQRTQPDSFKKWMPAKKQTDPDSGRHDQGQGRSTDSASRNKSATDGTGATVSAHQAGAAHHKTKSAGAGADKDMHPSWQASKTKQAGIVAFQGKKITFD
jgi:hypothetical protein